LLSSVESLLPATSWGILVPAIIGLESAVNPLVSDNSPSWSSNINDFMV
jgi:hypothetical protein